MGAPVSFSQVRTKMNIDKYRTNNCFWTASHGDPGSWGEVAVKIWQDVSVWGA